MSTIVLILLDLHSFYSVCISNEAMKPRILLLVMFFSEEARYRGGQTTYFCHGYQEGVFLSLIFDN